jgi:hypothetical protein
MPPSAVSARDFTAFDSVAFLSSVCPFSAASTLVTASFGCSRSTGEFNHSEMGSEIVCKKFLP